MWISNPVTIPPIFYATYLLGAQILNADPLDFNIELSIDWVLNNLADFWAPLFVGSLVAGIFLSVIAYFAIHLVWRRHVSKAWEKRKRLRQQKALQSD